MIVSPLMSHSARHPDADIVVVEGELGPAVPSQRLLVAPYDIHRSDEEIFNVLVGNNGFEVGDEVRVPPGAIHTWWTIDPELARYLIIAIHQRPYTYQEMKRCSRRTIPRTSAVAANGHRACDDWPCGSRHPYVLRGCRS